MYADLQFDYNPQYPDTKKPFLRWRIPRPAFQLQLDKIGSVSETLSQAAIFINRRVCYRSSNPIWRLRRIVNTCTRNRTIGQIGRTPSTFRRNANKAETSLSEIPHWKRSSFIRRGRMVGERGGPDRRDFWASASRRRYECGFENGHLI